MPDRTSQTLISIIQLLVTPGTKMITYNWRAYFQTEALEFPHLSVNHNMNFWRRAKVIFLSTAKDTRKRNSRLGEHILKKITFGIIFYCNAEWSSLNGKIYRHF
ncbi:hypothetical protein HZS_5238 [Henneguya salminicola]|nr:hypothetical protein HZS_5238 [Henneguya salminicola]